MNTQRAITAAVRAFLTEHSKNPFELLRERSVQGRLAELIRQKLGPRATTVADIYACGAKQWLAISAQKPQKISRVQLEIKLGSEGPVRSKDELLKHWRKDPDKSLGDHVFDIVVLRESTDDDRIGLYCHVGSGPGDIIAKVAYKDVVAVIEVKASPLFRMDQHKSFDADVSKLLNLQALTRQATKQARKPMIQCLFVYLDKSMGLYAGEKANEKKHKQVLNKLKNEARHAHLGGTGMYEPHGDAEFRFLAHRKKADLTQVRVELHHLKETSGKCRPHIRVATVLPT
jgi:hypothetical protein